MKLFPQRPRLRGPFLLPILCVALVARGDGPGDNQPENVRRIPKPGIELPAAERESITAGLAELDAAIAPLASSTPDQRPRLFDGGARAPGMSRSTSPPGRRRPLRRDQQLFHRRLLRGTLGRAASLVAIAERLREQPVAEPDPLMATTDSQPGKNGHREPATRELFGEFSRKVAEIHLPCRQRVIPCDVAVRANQNLRGRQSLGLVLQRLGMQPAVDFALAAIKQAARTRPAERLEREPLRKHDAAHRAPRIMAPSRRCTGVNARGDWSACQKANCSEGVRVMVLSRALAASRRACGTVTVWM